MAEIQRPEEKMRMVALEYLKSTYAEDFTAVRYVSRNWAYDFSRIYVTSPRYPGVEIEVRIHEKDGKYTFQDNYYHCYMMEDAVSYFNKLDNIQPAEIRVRFPSNIWSDRMAAYDTFEAWVESGMCAMDVFVITGASLTEEEMRSWTELVCAKRIRGAIQFFTTKDENLLSDYSLDEILNNQRELTESGEKYYIDTDFVINRR